jgi:O-antigen/teichoic acid export membrane protein
MAIAVSLMLTGLYTTMRYWLIRKGEYRVISVATIGQSIGRVATQVLAGIARIGWPGLIGGEVIGRAAGLRQMAQGTWRDVRQHSFPLNITRLRMTASTYQKFPLYTAPSSLLNSLALTLPVPLISGAFGVDAAGQFSIASRVLLLPLALVGASIGDVFHNRVSLLSREHPERCRSF